LFLFLFETRQGIYYSALISPHATKVQLARAKHVSASKQFLFAFGAAHTCSLAVDGCRQILLGFFKKVVIADNCAVHVNYIFDNYNILDGSTLLLGAFYFAF